MLAKVLPDSNISKDTLPSNLGYIFVSSAPTAADYCMPSFSLRKRAVFSAMKDLGNLSHPKPLFISSKICAMKWNDLHLRPRGESITEDNVESNCSMTRKEISKRSEFLRFNLYFCHVISEFGLFSFRNTKISENSGMTKSWAARLCSLASPSNRLCRLPKQELFVAQVLKKFKL